MERHPWEATGEFVFCSTACRAAWLSEEYLGAGHPNWKGGGAIEYGQGWRRARLDTLERDGSECVVCGTGEEGLGRLPDVHHVVPVRVFMESDGYEAVDAHFVENLVVLCPGCHRRADFGRIGAWELWERVGVAPPDWLVGLLELEDVA